MTIYLPESPEWPHLSTPETSPVTPQRHRPTRHKNHSRPTPPAPNNRQRNVRQNKPRRRRQPIRKLPRRHLRRDIRTRAHTRNRDRIHPPHLPPRRHVTITQPPVPRPTRNPRRMRQVIKPERRPTRATIVTHRTYWTYVPNRPMNVDLPYAPPSFTPTNAA